MYIDNRLEDALLELGDLSSSLSELYVCSNSVELLRRALNDAEELNDEQAIALSQVIDFVEEIKTNSENLASDAADLLRSLVDHA